MPENNRRTISPYGGGGFIQGIADQIRLIARLMADGRVNFLLKLLPATGLVYWLVPDLVPGPIDDALVIWLSTVLFVELCPPDVVQEHKDAIDRLNPKKATKVVIEEPDNKPAQENPSKPEEPDVIEGEFHEEK